MREGLRHHRDPDGPPVMTPERYYHNGVRLVWVVEADHSGAILEDSVSYEWFEVEPREAYKFKPVPWPPKGE